MAGLNIPIPTTPAEPTTATPNTELLVQRKITHAFIRAEPVDLGLSRRAETRTPGGGVDRNFVRQLPTQTFKIIMISPAGGSIEQRAEDGTERRTDFVLLGEWNADVAIGDYWDDSTGQRWEIQSLIPYNGYEVRANVASYGRRPLGG